MVAVQAGDVLASAADQVGGKGGSGGGKGGQVGGMAEGPRTRWVGWRCILLHSCALHSLPPPRPCPLCYHLVTGVVSGCAC